MKLIYCNFCGDVRALSLEERVCHCGRSGGHYHHDRLRAFCWGPCRMLGFANGSFRLAKEEEERHPNPDRGTRFEAFIISEPCPTFFREDEDV